MKLFLLKRQTGYDGSCGATYWEMGIFSTAEKAMEQIPAEDMAEPGLLNADPVYGQKSKTFGQYTIEEFVLDEAK